jgi:hypothetical protein
VHEVNSGSRRLVPQHESRVRSVRSRSTRLAIEFHRQHQSGEEGHGDDGTPYGGRRPCSTGESIASVHHGGDTFSFTTRLL